MRLDLQDPLTNAMGSYMTRLSKRQQILASNLANIDTPGYKTSDISFHATMDELISQSSVTLKTRRTDQFSMNGTVFAPLDAAVFEVPGLPMRADMNNVNMDRELLNIGETSFAYSLMAQLLRGKFRTLSNAILDGRNG